MNTQNDELNIVRNHLYMSYWTNDSLSLKFSLGTFSIVGETGDQYYDLTKENNDIWIVSPDVKYRIIDIDQNRMILDNEGFEITLQKVS